MSDIENFRQVTELRVADQALRLKLKDLGVPTSENRPLPEEAVRPLELYRRST